MIQSAFAEADETFMNKLCLTIIICLGVSLFAISTPVSVNAGGNGLKTAYAAAKKISVINLSKDTVHIRMFLQGNCNAINTTTKPLIVAAQGQSTQEIPNDMKIGQFNITRGSGQKPGHVAKNNHLFDVESLVITDDNVITEWSSTPLVHFKL